MTVTIDKEGRLNKEHQLVKVLFLDLDGTVRRSKADPNGFISGPHDIELVPGILDKMQRYSNEGWYIAGISNQGGVAHGHKSHEQVDAEMKVTQSLCLGMFATIRSCYCMADGNIFPYNYRSLTRKPDIGMLVLIEKDFWENGMVIDYKNSLYVGDREEDKECARRAEIEFKHIDDFLYLKE